MKNKIKNNKGQIAIIILLASAIVLTLGLSASKSAVTDTKVDTDEELLKEAFNTAESGINNYLNTGNKDYITTGSGANVVSTIIGDADSLSSEGVVPANKNQLFWLVNHDADGNIVTTDYYQGSSIDITTGVGFTGALKVDYFYIDNGGVYQVQRLGCRYDNNSNSAFNNGFSSCSTLNITANTKPLLLAITPFGAATSLTITSSGSSPFPSQGEEIAASSTTDNGIKTQIKTRYIYQIPSFFLDAITAKNVVE